MVGSARSRERSPAPPAVTGRAAGRNGRATLDDEAVIRSGAELLARQAGSGVPRSTLVALTSRTGFSVTFLAGDPTIAVVRADTGRRRAGQPPPFQSTAAAPDRFTGLTERERQVAALLAAGLSNQQIAAELVVTVSTVKHHVHRILTKTGLSSRAAVAGAWPR